MDNLKLGGFIARLRKEKNLTQKELADKLHVTDKAVSKWETGKGFPDLKILEPLAQELGVSLVELLQGERQQSDTLTVAEAENVVARAMDRSERTTARKYLRLFRWLLTVIGAWAFLALYPHVSLGIILLYHKYIRAAQIGVIGGADGPTAILTASRIPPLWMQIGVPAVILLVCVILAVKVRRVEKKLK